MPHSIILTVAVTPNPSYSVILARPEIRLDHYRQAIRYWTKIAAERGFGLIIVETSGYQGELIPDENANTVGVKTSVVNFTPDVSSAMRGKGAVEADSLDYVINNSELGLRNTDTFYKVTGRLTLANTAVLVGPIRQNTVVIRRTLNRKFADSRFFGTTVAVWKQHLTGMAADIDDAGLTFLEHAIAHRLAMAEFSNHLVVTQFRERPRIIGYSGTSGKQYRRVRSVLVARVMNGVEKKMMMLVEKKQI